MGLLNKLLLIGFLFCSFNANAGIKSVLIGVDGLTCSACSFSTQKSIMKLDFVDTVLMDLKSTVATVTFKKDAKISLDALAQKVVDAGFSVRFISVIFDFNNLTVTDNFCYELDEAVYQFIGVKEAKTLEIVPVKIIGKKYCSKAEYKKWEQKIKQAVPCKASNEIAAHYYVTL